MLEWFYKERVPRLFGESELNLDKFVSNQLFLPGAPDPEIKYQNITHMIQMYIVLIVVSMVVLLYEIFRFKNNSHIRIDERDIRIVRYTINRRRARRGGLFNQLVDKLRDRLFNRIVVV